MMFLDNFSAILLLFLICIVLAFVIFFIPYLLTEKVEDKEKLSSYECGFNPFTDSRGEFDTKFYIVALLFLIFDLEICLLFPVVLCLGALNFVGIISLLIFLLILTLGFFYE